MIYAQNISKTFNNKSVLENVNLEIKKGEVVSIVGPSGAGKTTLLHILSTLDKADNTEKYKLILNEKEIVKLNDKEISITETLKLDLYFSFMSFSQSSVL